MGSSFSIKNDTSETIWVSHGIHAGALFGGVSAGLGVVGWAVGNVITGIVSMGAGVASTLKGKEKQLTDKEELEKVLKLKGFERIEPGQTYGPKNWISFADSDWIRDQG